MKKTIQLLLATVLISSLFISGCSPSVPNTPNFESAWTLVEQGEEPRLRQAIEQFEACIDANPDDAPCQAGLAIAYSFIAGDYNITDPGTVSIKARNAAARALELDDQLAFAHFAMAEIQASFDWNWGKAEKHYERAIEIDPNNAIALEQYCFFLMNMGRLEEAGRMVTQLKSIDPDRPTAFLEYLITGNANQAESTIAKLIASDPNNIGAYWMGSCVSAREGDYEQAVSRLQKQISLMDGDIDDEIAMLGWAYGRLGRTEDARQTLQRLEEANPNGAYISPVVKSWIYIGLGETDKSLALLKEGVEQKANRSGLGMGHFFAFLYQPISDDPRYQALLNQIGLGK